MPFYLSALLSLQITSSYSYWDQRASDSTSQAHTSLYTHVMHAYTHSEFQTLLKIPVSPLSSLLGSAGKRTRGNVRDTTASAAAGVGGCGRACDKSEAILLPRDPTSVPNGRLGSVVSPRQEQQKRSTRKGKRIVRARCERTAGGPRQRQSPLWRGRELRAPLSDPPAHSSHLFPPSL